MDYTDHFNELPLYKDWAPTGFDIKGLDLGSACLQNMRVLLYRDRDSDPLTRSNFIVALDQLGGETEHVQVHRFGHWACGWFEIILVDDTVAEIAGSIACALSSYPVLDEEHFCALENEEASQFWRDSFTEKERIRYIRDNAGQFDFENLGDLRSCIRGDYFGGYASELLGR